MSKAKKLLVKISEVKMDKNYFTSQKIEQLRIHLEAIANDLSSSGIGAENADFLSNKNNFENIKKASINLRAASDNVMKAQTAIKKLKF